MALNLSSIVDSLVTHACQRQELHAAKKPAQDSHAGEDAIIALHKLMGEDMERINRLIIERIFSEVGVIPELARHIISSGGKRLRPLITITAARLCGYEGEIDHVKLAASVELMHTATLLHDDVVDGQAHRRGKKTARMIWGNQASVLVGDFLLGRAFKMMVECGSIRALELLSQAASVIAEGEVLQLASTARDPNVTYETEYLRIIESKTAALFAAAAELGAVVAHRPPQEAAALRSYGLNLGIAFQIVDDALDYAGTTAALGKDTGQDFKEGKITLPVILAFRRGSEVERAFWVRTLHHGDQHEGDLQFAIDLIASHSATEDTLNAARQYADLAIKALDIFPDGSIKKALIDVCDFAVHRSH